MRALVTLALLLLVGCTETLPSGRVVAKQYVPSHTDFVPIMVGKSTTVMPVYHPACWLIVIAGVDSKGNEITNEVSVSSGAFAAIEVGQTYVRPK